MSYFVRPTTNQGIHDKAVKDIARKRFDGVKYDVYTNPGGEKNAYVGSKTNPIHPDILVLEKGYGLRTAIAIGEIETSDSITDNEADQWKEYAATKIPFYLYIPAGNASKATDILKKKGIKISGLRTYKYDSLGELIVSNIF
ncbi:MAG: hypothetical protein WC297_00065 [Candidatus Paceibacterota bacterium]|jgi:hypothetical protein